MPSGAGAQKSIAEINERLRQGRAVVLTAHELKEQVRGGKNFTVADIDVVTTGTRGPMSGSAAALSFNVKGWVAPATEFRLWLNGVPAFPGPAANPGEAVVDAVVFGTAESRYEPQRYGGGNLLRDLLEGRPVQVEIEPTGGARLRQSVALDDFNLARLYNVRNTFKNYMAFANFKGREPMATIFGFRPMRPDTGITVVGSGEISPLQNDPELRLVRVGTRILVNGAAGMVLGSGTRSSAARPNLSVTADMFDMDPEYMGGFMTDACMEVMNAIAVPIPIVDAQALATVLAARDEDIALPIADVGDRVPFTQSTYAEAWRGNDLAISYDPERCVTCSFACVAERYCPVGAISWHDKRHDDQRCVACGACTINCLGGAFSAKLGSLAVNGRSVPITFRQSDKRRGMKIAELLKARMQRGEFLLAELGERITHES